MADQQAFIVTDYGAGDAGKGSITDFLVRKTGAHSVIKTNGGSQAAHNVVTTDGRHHVFAQFGSGTFLPGTTTLLSQHMLVNPWEMLIENEVLANESRVFDGLDRMYVHAAALVSTPLHMVMNRVREIARGADRHGSCGKGIGETMADVLAIGNDALVVGDLRDRATAQRKLLQLRDRKRDEVLRDFPSIIAQLTKFQRDFLFTNASITNLLDIYQTFVSSIHLIDDGYIEATLRKPGTIIFEGAQGVLLDEWYGFHPYTTWSTTTGANATRLLQQHRYTGEVTRLGLLRVYATRHGAGPFVTEDAALTAAIPDVHNGTDPWQQAFRIGHFDMMAVQYAMAVAGAPDFWVLTNLDRLLNGVEHRLCVAYRYVGDAPLAVLSRFLEIENGLLIAIKPSPQPDLAYQEQLTQLLLQCEPEYAATYDNYSNLHLVSGLQSATSVPVGLVSLSPTALEKNVLNMVLNRKLRSDVLV